MFDTLDQGISAAQQGLGISVVDLVLASADLAAGRLVTPFKHAVATGDGYYMTWLKASPKARQMHKLREFYLAKCRRWPARTSITCTVEHAFEHEVDEHPQFRRHLPPGEP